VMAAESAASGLRKQPEQCEHSFVINWLCGGCLPTMAAVCDRFAYEASRAGLCAPSSAMYPRARKQPPERMDWRCAAACARSCNVDAAGGALLTLLSPLHRVSCNDGCRDRVPCRAVCTSGPHAEMAMVMVGPASQPAYCVLRCNLCKMTRVCIFYASACGLLWLTGSFFDIPQLGSPRASRLLVLASPHTPHTPGTQHYPPQAQTTLHYLCTRHTARAPGPFLAPSSQTHRPTGPRHPCHHRHSRRCHLHICTSAHV
jgi:hypothetical protein